MIDKNTVIFDKKIERPTTEKARIASVNINVINQEVVVVYHLGNVVDEEFVVLDQKSVTFSSQDGKEDFRDVLAGMKIDMDALISILAERI